MTKAAVISLTKTLAVELGPSGIRVNAIAPGIVQTRFAAALTSNDVVVDRYLDRTPLKRVGAPEDVAGVALLLASEAAGYITGETIVVEAASPSPPDPSAARTAPKSTRARHSV
jgi:NAD(P)-dependent dehydrogenase (short-subunit alcohol dehydrogenase family)